MFDMSASDLFPVDADAVHSEQDSTMRVKTDVAVVVTIMRVPLG
jgi:hypothetical protein